MVAAVTGAGKFSDGRRVVSAVLKRAVKYFSFSSFFVGVLSDAAASAVPPSTKRLVVGFGGDVKTRTWLVDVHYLRCSDGAALRRSKGGAQAPVVVEATQGGLDTGAIDI